MRHIPAIAFSLLCSATLTQATDRKKVLTDAELVKSSFAGIRRGECRIGEAGSKCHGSTGRDSMVGDCPGDGPFACRDGYTSCIIIQDETWCGLKRTEDAFVIQKEGREGPLMTTDTAVAQKLERARDTAVASRTERIKDSRDAKQASHSVPDHEIQSAKESFDTKVLSKVSLDESELKDLLAKSIKHLPNTSAGKKQKDCVRKLVKRRLKKLAKAKESGSSREPSKHLTVPGSSYTPSVSGSSLPGSSAPGSSAPESMRPGSPAPGSPVPKGLTSDLWSSSDADIWALAQLDDKGSAGEEACAAFDADMSYDELLEKIDAEFGDLT